MTTAPVTTATNPPASKPQPADPLANKDTFIKLLVAQLRNQNPLQPTDGIEFVTQLAQFSGLEQTLEIRQDLAAIRKLLESQSAAAAGKDKNA